MRRLMLAAVSWLTMSAAAEAACPATITDCPSPTYNDLTVNHLFIKGVSKAAIIYASDYGVKADGVTSDDVALKAAFDACAAAGTRLLLPPGRILMTGVAGPITVQNCGIEGTGPLAGLSTSVPSQGSMLLLTSTTVKPFVTGRSWTMSGINFYWPNQTDGVTVFPPLLNMDIATGQWAFFNNVVVNAYDLLADTPGFAQGEQSMHDNIIYAAHDVWRSSGQGDEIFFNNNALTPGPWFNMQPGTSTAAVDAAALVNTIFHVTTSAGKGWNIIAKGNDAFDWRYLFKVENGGLVGISDVSFVIDGVGTVIDTSAGGRWATGNKIVINGDCNTFSLTSGPGVVIGNNPCFRLGSLDNLTLDGSNFTGSGGSFIESVNSTLTIRNTTIGTTGQINDGNEYYQVLINNTTTGPVIVLQNNIFQGSVASNKAHVHGIKTVTQPGDLIIQNNRFANNQEQLDIKTGFGKTMISGNWSFSTWGPTSMLMSGTDRVAYANNNWDKPATATISACGASPTITGEFAGSFIVGTTVPTTSCTLTLPFALLGAPVSNGSCAFTPTTPVIVSATNSGNPPVWVVSFSADVHGQRVFFSCPGVI